MEFKWFTILIIGVLALFTVGDNIRDAITNNHEEKMAEKGYEQVVEDGKVIWQKRK